MQGIDKIRKKFYIWSILGWIVQQPWQKWWGRWWKFEEKEDKDHDGTSYVETLFSNSAYYNHNCMPRNKA